MPTPAEKPGDAPDFDHALDEVEKIIARIESGEIGLEQSIGEYERGAALLRVCRDRLTQAQQKVKDLTAQLNADAAARPAARRGGPGDDDGDKDAPF